MEAVEWPCIQDIAVKSQKDAQKSNKTGDHRLEKFTNLWQRLFSPIRSDRAVDVARLALFCTGDGPHM